MAKGKLAAAGVVALIAPFVAFYEGYSPTGYADPVGVPTICYGYAAKEVRLSDKATREQCEALLTIELWEHYQRAMACVRVPLRDNEAAAITSFAYNVGTEAFCASTMARQINAGVPAATWCQQLDRWVYAGGIKLRGLVKRRAKEKAICLGTAPLPSA